LPFIWDIAPSGGIVKEIWKNFMKKYEKPAVLLNANVADEIYMASGSKVTAFRRPAFR